METPSPQIEQRGAVTVVLLADGFESVDETKIDSTRDELLRIADGADPPVLVVDLSKTDFFGSSFIEVLFRVWNRLRRRNGHFAIAGLKAYPEEVIRIERLDTLWEIYPDCDTAVRALQGRDTSKSE